MHTKKRFRLQARQFRALGNESRLHILFLLTQRAMHLHEIARELGIRMSNASVHVHKLIVAGFVEGKRIKTCVRFSLTPVTRKVVRTAPGILTGFV